MSILNDIIEYIGSAQIATAASVTPLKVDGEAGKSTIKMLQGWLGCPKSGVLTGQKKSLMKKYAPNVTAFQTSGSPALVVAKLQAWVGFDPAFINGIWDNNLSYALQYHLALYGYNPGAVDAVFGRDSVKALQRFLNAQIPQPVPSGMGDKIIQACKEQADWMHDAEYGDYAPVTIAHSKKRGTCVTYEGCVFQRVGMLSSGKYVWHTGRGYGTGKVTGANHDTMTVTYMGNRTIKSLKKILQKGDCLLLDDNKSGEGGNGGHVMFFAKWKGNKPYVWDVAPGMSCCRNGKPRAYNGDRKVLAIVRAKGGVV